MPDPLELLAEQDPACFALIISYLDMSSLSNLQRALPRLGRPEHGFGALADDLFHGALRDFQSLTGRMPQLGPLPGSDQDRAFEIEQLRILHQVIQLVLDGVNRVRGDEAELNVITGEDLLYTVGRLSMMVNDQDFLPGDTRAIPLNWTTTEFLEQRARLSPSSIPRITDQLSSSAAEQRRRTAPFDDYTSDANFRIYEILRRALVKNLETAGDTLIGWSEGDLYALNAVVTLASSMSRPEAMKTLRSLARANKRFLVLMALCPPPVLLQDRLRRDVVLQAFRGLASTLSSRTQLLDSMRGKGGDSLEDMVKARRNRLSEAIKQMQRAFTQMSGKVELMKWKGKGDFRNLALPWGAGHHVGMAYAGSVRLIFSQALSIMHAIGDTSSAALDLSYERIVDYLERLPSGEVMAELSSALANPLAVKNAFFGELAILLVGIEGSQNNMTVLQAPMCLDLVAAGHLTWAQVLFQRMDIPFFVMGADKTEKGLTPMVRQGQMLSQGAVSSSDQSEKTYPKFERFFQRELDLNTLFFKVFFPRLRNYARGDQLVLSALCAARYLGLKFNVSPKAAGIIYGNVARMLAGLVGDSRSTRKSRPPERSVPEFLEGQGKFAPSRSGQVYPVHLGLPERVNEILTYSEVVQWYDEAAGETPSVELLERLDQIITHLDWQVAELEPDPYERQAFANRVRQYAGPSRAAFETWRMFCRFVDLRSEISARVPVRTR